MNEKKDMMPENGFPVDGSTPFLFRHKIAEAQAELNRRIRLARIKKQASHVEEVFPGVNIVVPELEVEKYAGAWEEEQAKGWNENIQPGASVQWYQEGSRSPNLGDVIEIDPVYQTYKVRDAYTGEVSVQSKVKIFSKKMGGQDVEEMGGQPGNVNCDECDSPNVELTGSTADRRWYQCHDCGVSFARPFSLEEKSGGFDPHAPGESIGQSQLWDEEPYALFEQGGKYYKVPLNDPMTDAGWSNVEEIDAEELARLKGEEPMTGLAKRAISYGPLQSGRGEKLVSNIAPWATIEPNEAEGMVMLRWEGTNGLYGSGNFASEEEAMQHVQKLLDAGILITPNDSKFGAFEESKHPRGQGGQFSSGGGGGTAKSSNESGNISDETYGQFLQAIRSSGDAQQQFDAMAEQAGLSSEERTEIAGMLWNDGFEIVAEPGGEFTHSDEYGTSYHAPESDEFMQRMLEVGPGPGDKVRLKDGTETEWSEENMNDVEAFMPGMGPQQWFANQEKPKKKRTRRSSKFAEDVPEHGVLSQYQPFAALNEQTWMSPNDPERWKLIWIYDDAPSTNGEAYFPSQEEAVEYLEEMAAEGLIRKTGVLKRATDEYPEEGDSPKSDECPACSGQGDEIDMGVFECENCHGLFGSVLNESDLANYVDLRFDSKSAPGEERYFDFTIEDTGQRIHGWFNPETKKITQIG